MSENETLEEIIYRLENKISFIEGFTEGLKERIQELEKKIRVLDQT
jgi:hypothetical protein